MSDIESRSGRVVLACLRGLYSEKCYPMLLALLGRAGNWEQITPRLQARSWPPPNKCHAALYRCSLESR